MLIKTEQFKEVASTILFAADLDKNAANLELCAHGNVLRVAVTNKEYYVAVNFDLEAEETFQAVVDAPLFLNLISGITTDTFELLVNGNVVSIKAGKSNYKVPLNGEISSIPVIKLDNKTVEMGISNDILKSILTVNSREISKAKNLDANELQRLYYIDETGCFTFTTGACLNAFTLEKPVKLLLNERIVKLFKLFKEDVGFAYGVDSLANGSTQTKVVFQTSNIYVAALVTCDDVLINKVMGPCNATKNLINQTYANRIVVSATALSNAASRLLMFTKNSVDKANIRVVPATIVLNQDEMVISDNLGNNEVVTTESDSVVENGYKMIINLADLKLAVDSYKNEHITISCGNHRSVVINCGPVNSLIPEGKQN